MKFKLKIQIALILLLVSPNTAFSAFPLYINDIEFPIKQNTLILDSNNTGGNVSLQFGRNNNEKLFWDSDGGTGTGIFDLSNSLTLNGLLGVGIKIPISILHIYENTTNTDGQAGMTIENQGSGDSVLQFLLTGVSRWVIGIDNSDSTKFKIASTQNLDTDTKLTIDLSGDITIGSTLTLHDNYIKDTGPLNLQASGNTNYHLFLSTISNLPGIFWAGGLWANAPGIRLNSSNQIEYRDQNESAWTTFDSLGFAGNVFGTEFYYAESNNVSLNTTANYQNKATLTTGNLPAGIYRIGINYGWNLSVTNRDFQARIQINGADLGQLQLERPFNSQGAWGGTGSNQRFNNSKTFYRSLNGINAITLDFRPSIGGPTAAMWDASIELWRVQ